MDDVVEPTSSMASGCSRLQSVDQIVGTAPLYLCPERAAAAADVENFAAWWQVFHYLQPGVVSVAFALVIEVFHEFAA